MSSIKLIFAIFAVLAASPALAYVMSSTSYQIERDSINMGGGLSNSASYISQSSIGGIGSGSGTSTSYILTAGYQQMDASSISLTVPGTTAMPGISGSTGGTADVSAAINVATDNGAGYTLQIKASTTPAMKSGSNSFADYTLAGADPDYTWAVADSASEFGFTPEGADIVARYKDNGVSCNQAGGADTIGYCWDSLNIAYNTIAKSSYGNLPSGTATTVKFQAQAGASAAQPAGTYTATIIFTAFVN